MNTCPHCGKRILIPDVDRLEDEKEMLVKKLFYANQDITVLKAMLQDALGKEVS
jgi:hypothetical protein